jgi:hypothetical protein
MAQVQKPREVLCIDVVGADQPVEVLARLDAERPDLPREVRAEPGFKPGGLVPETVVDLSAIATGRAIAHAGFLEKHYGSTAARKM